jgi:serine protease Do
MASLEISEIYKTAKPSVVVVESPPLDISNTAWDSSEESTPPPDQDITDSATGIVFTKDGHVLTNHHVIQNVISDYVRVKLSNGKIVKARILGTDPKTDLAVLKLPPDAPKPPPLKRGDSDNVNVGDFVCAIGSPYGLEFSLSMGIVSGRGRNPLTHSAYEDYIQTDAAINPGNSGGPLLNTRGEWIGVNTLMNGINRGLGFAIPSNQALKLAEEILDRGQVERPWLGFRIAVSGSFDQPPGLVLSWVTEDSPAGRAGLKTGDIVKKINGEVVSTPSALQKRIWEAGLGGSVELEFERSGRIKRKVLQTSKMPENDFSE